MKATLDHIGIAVSGLPTRAAFYRDALGLEVSAPHEVPTEQVRAHVRARGPGVARVARGDGAGFGDRPVRSSGADPAFTT